MATLPPAGRGCAGALKTRRFSAAVLLDQRLKRRSRSICILWSRDVAQLSGHDTPGRNQPIGEQNAVEMVELMLNQLGDVARHAFQTPSCGRAIARPQPWLDLKDLRAPARSCSSRCSVGSPGSTATEIVRKRGSPSLRMVLMTSGPDLEVDLVAAFEVQHITRFARRSNLQSCGFHDRSHLGDLLGVRARQHAPADEETVF
jgi:hypothetical protein